MFNRFFGARRPRSARRVFHGRPRVERLEGRDAPSALDLTSLSADMPDSPSTPTPPALAPADSATSSDGLSVAAYVPGDPAPPPRPEAGTLLAILTVVPPADAPPPAPIGVLVAGGLGATDPGPGPGVGTAASPPAAPGLTEPMILGAVGDSEWSYTVKGIVTDPNPTALTIRITVDGTVEPPATPDAAGRFSVTFTLPPCTSATNATRFGTAVATDGVRVSPPALFDFTQVPRPPAG